MVITIKFQYDLLGNNIGPEGAQHISEMIKFNSTITLLDLDRNGLDSNDKYILEAMKLNSTIEVLLMDSFGGPSFLAKLNKLIREGL